MGIKILPQSVLGVENIMIENFFFQEMENGNCFKLSSLRFKSPQLQIFNELEVFCVTGD